jgi:hypothetical protein
MTADVDRKPVCLADLLAEPAEVCLRPVASELLGPSEGFITRGTPVNLCRRRSSSPSVAVRMSPSGRRLLPPYVRLGTVSPIRVVKTIERMRRFSGALMSPEQAKELLRLLVKEIRVHNRRRILPIYRVPAAVRAIPRKVGGTWQCANQPLICADAIELS